jgi:LDH2 family malate/lactate/ureidoglycolate dehydrogenase
MPAVAAGSVAIDAQRLISAVADIFMAVGIAAADAQVVAADLVAADLEGIASHGVMLVPM